MRPRWRPPLPSPSVITSLKENPPTLDTSLHVQRPDAAGPGATPASPHCSPDARPHYCARAAASFQVAPRTWRRCPRRGGGRGDGGRAAERALRARARSSAGVGGGGGGRGAAPPAPPPPPPPLLARLGPRASRSRALGRGLGAQGSDFVSQQSLPVIATPLEARAGRAARGRGGSAAAGGEGGKGAREGRVTSDRGPAAGLTWVTASATRGRGTGSSKTKPKMGNGEAGAALRGVLCRCLGPKRLWLPEIRASRSSFLSFLRKCACASGSRGALGAALSAQRRGGRRWRGEPSSQHPRSSQYPLPRPSPPPSLGPDSPRRPSWSLGLVPTPRGVAPPPGPSQCFHWGTGW